MNIQSHLLMLQHADSFFPSGASSWSWGLEALAQDDRHLFQTRSRQRQKKVTEAVPEHTNAQHIQQFVLSQIQHRWYAFDVIFLLEAWKSAADLDRLMSLDQEVDCLTLVNEARQGSMKLGSSLLRLYPTLELSRQWLAQIQEKQAYGHSCVVQGAVFAQLGMTEEDALLSSAHAFCTSLVSAAIRLGLIGYLEAQHILTVAHTHIATLMQQGIPSLDALSTFNPMVEIAMMRHEFQDMRLFSN